MAPDSLPQEKGPAVPVDDTQLPQVGPNCAYYGIGRLARRGRRLPRIGHRWID